MPQSNSERWQRYERYLKYLLLLILILMKGESSAYFCLPARIPPGIGIGFTEFRDSLSQWEHTLTTARRTQWGFEEHEKQQFQPKWDRELFKSAWLTTAEYVDTPSHRVPLLLVYRLITFGIGEKGNIIREKRERPGEAINCSPA
jgi:hypothetical protein